MEDARIIGIYASLGERKLGEGGTSRQARQEIYWFAMLVGEKVRLVPLNDRRMPAGPHKLVSVERFERDYAPEPAVYLESITPVIRSLLDKLGTEDKAAHLIGFGPDEKLLYKAVQPDMPRRNPDGSRESPYVTARRILAAAEQGHGELVQHQRRAINTLGIQARKQRDLDSALTHYRKALALSPEDDHLHFNIARVHYELGDMASCRECLEACLKLNPELEPALRMRCHLDKKKAR